MKFGFLLLNLLIISLNILFANSDLLKINNQIEKEQREELLNNSIDRLKPKIDLEIKNLKTVDSKKRDSNICIEIKNIEVKYNFNVFVPKSLYEKFENSCITSDDIKNILFIINRYYQEKGLITTRAYVEEQNLKLGSLKITVVAGVLSGYKYFDSAKSDNRLNSAFPINIGEVIYLRDLEQGVDNFNFPSSQQGKIELVPALNQGESFIVMKQHNSKPWKINLSMDNSGYKSTGENKGYIGLSYDNLFNVNDVVKLAFNRNLDDKNSKKSQSENFYYIIPYKNFLFSYSYYHHTYHRIIQGINEKYFVDGYSSINSYELDYLLYRNQTSRLKLFTNLSLKKSRNYIENFEIKTQRRDLTILDIGLFGDTIKDNFIVDYTFGAKFGLKIFGANDIVGISTSKSQTYHTKISSKIALLSNKYYFNTTFKAQYSPNELSGSEQFGVGGRYDVRGFHEDSLYGNSGAYIRNELETALQRYNFLGIKFFTGLDMGFIKDSKNIAWSSNEIIGASLGARFSITEYLNGDLTFSRALKRPDEFVSSKEQIYFSVNLEF